MFSRRTWIKLLAGAASLISAPLQAKIDPEWRTVRMPNGAATFEQLKTWIAELPNQQERGSPTAACAQTGEKYKEIIARYLARPGDEAVAEKLVVEEMQREICKLFTDRLYGTIFWRIPLEHETLKSFQIIEFRDDGPDLDYRTGRRCVMDHNWIAVAAYCRLVVAKELI